jgi:phosphohistidine phosphatase
MKLYLVRHAIAAERDTERWRHDSERPLTSQGVKRFRRVARALRQLAPVVQVTLSSRAVRAWDTAGLLRDEAGWPAPLPFRPLWDAHSPQDIVMALAPVREAASVALVGHEPTMGELASYLLTGDAGRLSIDWKKGGVMCLECPALEPGAAQLRWALPPGIAGNVK